MKTWRLYNNIVVIYYYDNGLVGLLAVTKRSENMLLCDVEC